MRVRVRVSPTTRDNAPQPRVARAQPPPRKNRRRSRSKIFISQDIRYQKQKLISGVRLIPSTGILVKRRRKKTRVKSSNKKLTTRGRTLKRRSIQKRKYQKYYPKGKHITVADFKCIFCYEFPIGEEVVICPHCGRPMHNSEFEMWIRSSRLCSRCLQPVSAQRMIRLTDAEYAKVLKSFFSNPKASSIGRR
ncbi:MAG: hypothetical protein ACFFC7_26080 [Candidatus Hermodarchaeota archaeon]